jgi:hypothetical protein
MGPQASVLLHKRIIDGAAQRGATNGEDFPEITHLSLPIADFISSSKTTDAALRRIVAALEQFYPWRKRHGSYCL